MNINVSVFHFQRTFALLTDILVGWGGFEVHGPMPDSIQNVWKQIFSGWFPSHQYEHAGTPELEVYSEGDPFSSDYYSEIWIPLR